MEKSEPTLAPQWLRSGGGSRHVTSFVTVSDDHAPVKLGNGRSLSMNMRNNELGHSASSDRAVSTNSRWSSNSSSSSNFRSYSSFRSHRNRDMDKDTDKYRERSSFGNHRSRDLPGSLRKHHWELFEEEGLRRPQSINSSRISEKWPRNLSNSGKSNLTESNGQLASVSSVDSPIDRGIQPLETEEQQVSPGIGRVRSPGLGTTSRTTPSSTDNKSASALADVSTMGGNSNSGLSSVKQSASSGPSSPSFSKSISRGLNMAEAVAKGPPAAQTTSKLSQENQRREELAVKQSRQLIPLKPLVAKSLVSISSDKPRTKVELLPQTVSSSLSVGRSLSNKLDVFSTTREKNGVSFAANSSVSPKAHTKGSTTLLAVPSSASMQSPANTAAASSASERKPVGTMMEKKLSSQAQSRNDFFNLMRKKSVSSNSAVNGAGRDVSPSSDKSGVSEVLSVSGVPQDLDASLSDESPRIKQSTEILGENTCSGDSYDVKNDTAKSFSKSEAIFCSEEEEAAFLRSLGWEEDADEGGLTDEEISAFYRDVTKYINSKLSYKIVQGVESRFLLPLHSGIGDVGGISS